MLDLGQDLRCFNAALMGVVYGEVGKFEWSTAVIVNRKFGERDRFLF
jgi:hypothetical protein